MIRKCYNCKRELTLSEAADGQKALDEVVESFPEFEGWVHCEGPPSEFVQENDTELKEACRGIDAELFPDSIHICRPCVVAQWRIEKGIDHINESGEDVKEFHEFIRNLSKRRRGMKEYRLKVEEVPKGETKEELISIAVKLDPIAIFNALHEGDKGRLLFRLLAAVLHDDSEFLDFNREEYTEAIKKAVRVIQRIYRNRWTADTCGLSADDAEMFGWDVTCLRKKERREKEERNGSGED